MNEQVTNILNQNITKTAKIQQLLLLGLTRRQVADLVTNGNYGFVQNVYKKMLEDCFLWFKDTKMKANHNRLCFVLLRHRD